MYFLLSFLFEFQKKRKKNRIHGFTCQHFECKLCNESFKIVWIKRKKKVFNRVGLAKFKLSKKLKKKNRSKQT